MRFKRFRNFFALTVLLAFFSSGCIWIVAGGIGALGGYVVSPDTVEGIIERTTDDVLETSLEISSIMGKVVEQDTEAGVIVSLINGARVTVTVLALSETTTRITVKARKAFMPRIATAQDFYIKVTKQLTD